MHIPDGLLSSTVCAASYVISGAVETYGISKKSGMEHDHSQVPAMGVMAAFIFAAQMVNFPVLGGTSGHLIGAVLAAVVFGPWNASIIMTTILIIQCLLFGDGGIASLGANVLNMGIGAVFSGYYTYHLFNRNKKGISVIAVFLGSWVSVVAAALMASAELALTASNSITFRDVSMLMVYWHMLIGIGEGIITAIILKYLARMKPDFF